VGAAARTGWWGGCRTVPVPDKYRTKGRLDGQPCGSRNKVKLVQIYILKKLWEQL